MLDHSLQASPLPQHACVGAELAKVAAVLERGARRVRGLATFFQIEARVRTMDAPAHLLPQLARDAVKFVAAQSGDVEISIAARLVDASLVVDFYAGPRGVTDDSGPWTEIESQQRTGEGGFVALVCAGARWRARYVSMALPPPRVLH